MRGRLGSLTPLARNVGVLIAYIVGATVDYGVIPSILIYIPIVYIVCLYLLPNTPQFYLQRDRFEVSLINFFLIFDSD